ncbi:hypothetical protein KZ483_14605 [Paenibacillus sp. sptzw28]|uniref:coiled-coil domain-containing protein n=1 Tax=Paenibacillus sp. sptzw28 TaxID=715179 RepID=UPI001C6E8B8C|nr:hypothetical protein [Paenibacillus sp. sptzw28]QYR19187.1 hypothetical protein KZ483_14605 [Paenibacillus sp. sptzw28]
MRRLTLFVLPVLIVLVSTPVLVYAGSELSDVEHELQEVQQEKKASQHKISDSMNQINVIQKDVLAANAKLDDLNNHINDVTNQTQSLQSNIQKEEADLTQTAQDLQDADSRVKQRDQMLMNKLQVIYKDGNVSFLDVLMHSTSFSDFLNRWQYLDQIIGFDKEMLERNKEDKKLIAGKETLLQQELAEVKQNYETIQQQQKTLLANKAKETVTIASNSQKEQDLNFAPRYLTARRILTDEQYNAIIQ